MQRIAQDWLVLAYLTNHSGTAVGVVMALQFGPPILLMPWVSRVVDRVDRRRLLLATQSAMGLTALALGILVIAGAVTLWQVYLFAAAMGCISAFDSPVRQTFVAELVGEDDLPNAVALNSTLFHSARLIGPAIAGLMIAAIGIGADRHHLRAGNGSGGSGSVANGGRSTPRTLPEDRPADG